MASFDPDRDTCRSCGFVNCPSITEDLPYCPRWHGEDDDAAQAAERAAMADDMFARIARSSQEYRP
jgi:hypothetical protein